MSIKVTCSKCGARLVFKGTAATVKPCPKCQMPIAFIPTQPEPAPSPPVTPVVEEPIAAVAVNEPESQPAVATKKIAAAPAKRTTVAAIVLGGLAAAFGGLCLLILACGGIAVIMFSGGRQDSLASESKGEPFSSVSDVGYTGSSYPPSPAIDYTGAAGALNRTTDTAAAAQAEKARAEEEQRRYAEEYWAQRDAEEALDRQEAEEAHERYMEAFRETIRMREAYP